MLSTSVGVWYALTHRQAFQVAFPGSTNPRVYAGLLSVAGIGLVALVGLWCWRRWAVALYGILAVMSVVLDVIARAPIVHQITIMSGAVAVFTLVYLNRRRFRAAGETGGV